MMRNGPPVDIIMGTYNGASFIKQQIESLISQTYSNWRLIVRDDGSKDNTVELVKALAATDSRIHILQDNLGNLGVNGNFPYLLSKSDANYVMYCDQDDVWLPEKVKLTMDEMLKIEQNDPNVPVLVHCDAVVVDSNLYTLKSRFIRSQAKKSSLSAVIFSNCAQGASIMINAKLRDHVLRLPPILLYDWHTAVIATALGKRSFLDKGLLLYRQHQSNLTGLTRNESQKTESKVCAPVQFAIDHFNDVENTIIFFNQELSAPIRKELEDAAYVLRGPSRLKRFFIAMRRRYAVSGRKNEINLFLYICGIQNF